MQSAKHHLHVIGGLHVCFEVRFKKLAVQVAFVRCRKGIIRGSSIEKAIFCTLAKVVKQELPLESCELKYLDFFMMYIKTCSVNTSTVG